MRNDDDFRLEDDRNFCLLCGWLNSTYEYYSDFLNAYYAENPDSDFYLEYDPDIEENKDHNVVTPEPSKNAQLAEKTAYPDDAIPDEFRCTISSQIMTDPVYTKETPNFIFDRNNILAWLTKNPTHPCTRQPISEKDLISADHLKNQITKFIKEHIEPYPEHMRQRANISLMASSLWAARLNKQSIIERRHDNDYAQHNYDIRYGVVAVSSV